MNQEKGKYVEKLTEMVNDVHVSMLITSKDKSSHPLGNALGVDEIDDDGTIWFFRKSSLDDDKEVEESENVSVAIVNQTNQNYLMINGTVSLVNDKNKMKKLWNGTMKAWFPKGLDDPDILLIKVSPVQVNYWDSASSKMIVLFNMLKAIVTEKPYTEEEHYVIRKYDSKPSRLN